VSDDVSYLMFYSLSCAMCLIKLNLCFYVNIREAILEKHPEILEDVKKESERMQNQRDTLLEQLNEKNEIAETPDAADDDDQEQLVDNSNDTLDGTDQSETGNQTDHIERGEHNEQKHEDDIDSTNATTTLANENSEETEQSNNKLTYDFKDITLEVIEQMKSDMRKLINFLLPQRTRDKLQPLLEKHVLPALKSFGLVAKDAGLTVYDMAKRYLMAFMNKEAGGSSDASGTDAKVPSEQNSPSRGGE